MAVTNVAKCKQELEELGYDVQITSTNLLRINTLDELKKKDIDCFLSASKIYHCEVSIKRSGAGLRILFM